MRDFAVHDDPAVQAQLDRLAMLSIPGGRLSLDPIEALLVRLGHPEAQLPPTFHVAGTNGKGSTTAFLRAILNAAGHTVHATNSPHLVRYNERFRIADRLISDGALAAILAEVLDANIGIDGSFFEVSTAAAFLAFAREPADAAVIEVGLGGRYDATNALPAPVVCGIASLALDHERFLLTPEPGVPLDPFCRVAYEKAGIAKPGAPLVTQSYPADMAATIDILARWRRTRAIMRGRDWFADVTAGGIHYRDARGSMDLPLPGIAGAHQTDNAALAVAMLRHQDALAIAPEAFAAGIRAMHWPARLQLLKPGPLRDLLPAATPLWLDGGHNPDAGAALARHFETRGTGLHLVLGMIAGKDPAALIDPLAPMLASVTAVPVAGHDTLPIGVFADLAARRDIPFASAETVIGALDALDIQAGQAVLIGGSLYLAGAVLRANDEIPD